MQTHSQIRADLLQINPEVARRSLLKFGIAALAGAWFPTSVKAPHIPSSQNVPDFLKHLNSNDLRLRRLNPICGTCLARLNIHDG